MTRILVLDRLVPAEARGTACDWRLDGSGQVADQVVQVRLADARMAATATDAALRDLLDGVDRIRLLASSCGSAPQQVVTRLRRLGAGPIRVLGAQLDGATAAPDTPIRFDDVARELVAGGLTVVDGPLVVDRPGQRPLHSERDPIADHLACLSHLGLDAPAARRVRLEGGPWLEGPSRLASWLMRVHEAGLITERIVLTPGATALAAAVALRVATVHALRTQTAPIQIEIATPDLPGALGGPATPQHLQDARDAWHDAPEPAVRHLQDGPRQAWLAAVATATERDRVADRAVPALGPRRAWVPALRRVIGSQPRVVVVPTWQCELRCRYCTIPKQGGRVMSRSTLLRALDLLFSADADELMLHFFGGEPLLEPELVRFGLETASARAAREGRRVQTQITTNGVALSEALLDLFARHDVRLQLSLDGDREVQNLGRRALDGAFDSYTHSVARHAAGVLSRGIEHEVIQVLHPTTVDRAAHSFEHLLDLGFRSIQLNYALGARWAHADLEGLARGLAAIEAVLVRRADDGIELVNAGFDPRAVRTNLEITVDHDGTVYGSTSFLMIPQHGDRFRLGHLDDARGWASHAADGLGHDDVMAWWYREEVAADNRRAGAILTSFARHVARGLRA